MKKILLSLLMLGAIAQVNAQASWTYDFGTTPQSGIAPTAWTNDGSYVPSQTQTDGGTSGILSKTTNAADGSAQLVNTGVSGFSGAYLKFMGATTSANSGSVFGLYDFDGTNLAFAQFKVYIPSASTNGRFIFYLGNGGHYENGSTFHTAETFASVNFVIGSSNSTINYFQASSNAYVTTNMTTSTISKDAIHQFMLFMNNGSNDETYSLNGSNTLASGTFDIWLDGTKILAGGTTAGLPLNTVINSLNISNVAPGSSAPVAYFDDIDYANYLQPIALPVALAQPLSASYSNSKVVLKWATATEINSKDFEIYHSVDARNYAKIGEEATSSPNGAQYTFTDNSPFNGANYYKLKQIDNDGNVKEFGPVVSYATVSKNNFTAFINNNGLAVNVTSDYAIAHANISLYGIAGSLIKSVNVNLAKGSNHFDFPLQVSSGVYIVNVIGNGIKLSKKMIKNI